MDSKDKAADETRVLPTVVAAAEQAASEAGGGRARRRPSAPLIAVLAACCLALVVFSLGFVQPAPDGSWSLAWMLPGSGTSGVAAGSEEPSAQKGSSQADDKATAAGEGSDQQQASDGAAGQDASSDGTDSDAGSSASAGTGSAASGSQGGGASSGGTSADGGSQGGASAPAPDTMTITVSVSSSAAGGSVSGGGTFTFERGATAYDALAACGLALGSDWGPMGVYVYSIGGLAEKQFDGAGGWMYAVNGSEPSYASSSYELSDGDSVSWYYVI